MVVLKGLSVNVTLDSNEPMLEPDVSHTQCHITEYQVHRVMLPLFWCIYMAIDESIQYNCGFLLDIILSTLCC